MEQLSKEHEFVVGQLERCPSTGKLHIQAYVECKSARDLKWYGSRGYHVEPCKGTQAQCIAYCTKEETRVLDPLTYGTKKMSQEESSKKAVEVH